jgi:hypothetical protein
MYLSETNGIRRFESKRHVTEDHVVEIVRVIRTRRKDRRYDGVILFVTMSRLFEVQFLYP